MDMKEDRDRVRIVLDYLESLGTVEIERLDIEIKSIGPPDAKRPYGAQIAKAVMALANHGGGVLIIGYKRGTEGYEEENVTEDLLATWEKTRLHDLLRCFMDPVPEVNLLFENGKSSKHPALVIPSHGRTPLICTRQSDHTRAGAVYIRKPGPKSEEPSKASEWLPLLRRCLLADREDLAFMFRTILEPPAVTSVSEKEVDDFHSLIARADERFDKLRSQSDSAIVKRKFGRWTIAHQLVPAAEGKSLRDMYSILQHSEGRETGWPIGVIMSHGDLQPRPWNDILEAWVVTKIFHAEFDYWFAKPSGFFYATRAFHEDIEPQTDKPVLEWIIPIWRMAEGILHATRVAHSYKTPVDHILFFARYQGLAGRVLWNSQPSMLGPRVDYVCRTDVWSNEIRIPPDLKVESLPDIVRALLATLYEQFDLFEMPAEVYNRQITQMLKGK